MKNDVVNMLIMMAIANNQYFLAICIGFSHRVNWRKLVKIIGKVSSEIAIVGSITNVKKAIAADGKPMPRNPLIIPANKNITVTNKMTEMSSDGQIWLFKTSITKMLRQTFRGFSLFA